MVNNLSSEPSLPSLSNPGTSDDLIVGKELIDSEGNVVVGTIPVRTTSDLTTSGATVEVPVGYYASQATKSVATATQATPSIDVSTGGLITASSAQSAGYVNAGTKSATKQLTTQQAKTVTPSTSDQTVVSSGVYTTGDIKVKGDANLVAGNIIEGVSIFGVAGSYNSGYVPTLNENYPADVTIVESASGSATFYVSISTPGKPAEYTYKWYVNGSVVSGATSSSYTKTGLTSAATYSIYCEVTNKAGTVTSRVATLTVQSAKPVYSYSGSATLIDDGSYNYRIKFLTSGTLNFSHLGKFNSIDVFCVGGGGGGNQGGGGGMAAGGSGIVVIRNARILS